MGTHFALAGFFGGVASALRGRKHLGRQAHPGSTTTYYNNTEDKDVKTQDTILEDEGGRGGGLGRHDTRGGFGAGGEEEHGFVFPLRNRLPLFLSTTHASTESNAQSWLIMFLVSCFGLLSMLACVSTKGL